MAHYCPGFFEAIFSAVKNIPPQLPHSEDIMFRGKPIDRKQRGNCFGAFEYRFGLRSTSLPF